MNILVDTFSYVDYWIGFVFGTSSRTLRSSSLSYFSSFLHSTTKSAASNVHIPLVISLFIWFGLAVEVVVGLYFLCDFCVDDGGGNGVLQVLDFLTDGNRVVMFDEV